MIRTLIADDDALLRAALRTMVDWEALGYTMVGDCTNGLQVLELLQRTTVDLLITDMKMPMLDGLGLIRRLRESSLLPVTVVLSGYDEYELVREAFRLGAHDYLLKGNLDTAGLTGMLTDLRKRIFADRGAAAAPAAGASLAPGSYGVAVFSIDDLAKQSERFGGDLKNRLDKPMLELVRQIPRVAGRAALHAAGPGQYELLWQVRDKARYHNTMLSVVKQIQSVWRDYMNLSVSAAVSDMVTESAVAEARELCAAMVPLAVLQGPGAVCTQHGYGELALACRRDAPVCEPLVEALGAGEDETYEKARDDFFRTLETRPEDGQTRLILALLAHVAQMQRKCGMPAGGAAGCESAVTALLTPWERGVWLRGLLRQERTRMLSASRAQTADPIKRARLFMEDNFTDHNLTLKTVADHVGLNEKYLSTQFTKRCGCTFISYLNALRLRYAQDLLARTDLKIYEISDRVGYNSIEHFNHIFKKNLCISPKDYRLQQNNS